MPPLVSILIPCFNAEPWIAETLHSALQQTWPNTEIILVDDDSTDRSLSIARAFQSAKLRVLRQNHAGAASARNYAYREAQGEFIQYLDADDLLASEKVETQVYALLNAAEHVAFCPWGRFDRSPSDTRFIRYPTWADMSGLDWLVRSWNGGGDGHPAAWLAPRSICEAAGPWDKTFSLNDDGEYFCRVLLVSKGVRFTPNTRTFYRSGMPGSLSGAKSSKALDSLFRSIESGTCRLLNRENSPRTRRASANSFQFFVFSTYPSCPELVAQAEARIRELGGSSLRCSGGKVFGALAPFVGWKAACRVQRLATRVRHSIFPRRSGRDIAGCEAPVAVGVAEEPVSSSPCGTES